MGLLGGPAVPITEFNRAMAVGVDSTPTIDELVQASAWLDAHAATSWSLQIAPSNSVGDVATFCNARALQPRGSGWAKWVTPLSAIQAPDHISSVVVRPVAAVTAVAFGETLQRGFGLPPSTIPWFAALPGRPGWHCFLAYNDERPIAGASLFVANGAAWSGMSATLLDDRGRGAQRSLIAARQVAAKAAGAAVYTTETGMPTRENKPGFSSYRNQKRSGATLAYVRPNWGR